MREMEGAFKAYASTPAPAVPVAPVRMIWAMAGDLKQWWGGQAVSCCVRVKSARQGMVCSSSRVLSRYLVFVLFARRMRFHALASPYLAVDSAADVALCLVGGRWVSDGICAVQYLQVQ